MHPEDEIKYQNQIKSRFQSEEQFSNAYDGQVFGLKIRRQQENIQDVICEEYRRDFLVSKKKREQSMSMIMQKDSRYFTDLKKKQMQEFVYRNTMARRGGSEASQRLINPQHRGLSSTTQINNLQNRSLIIG